MEKLLLTRIANYLMMNASFQDDLGVYRGKRDVYYFLPIILVIQISYIW